MNNYLCTILIELIFYKLTHVRIEDAFLDNIKCNNARRNHGEHDDNDSIPSNGFITFSINIFFVFKIKHSHTHKCSQKNKCPVAIAYPAVHSGGIRAVAIATPGRTLPLPLVHIATMPAAPPQKAISTSYKVGDVRASNSDCTSSNGEIMKYTVAVTTLMTTATK